MLRRSLLALAILVMIPAATIAQPFTAYGPHVGFTSGPDQFVIGGQLQMGEVITNLDFVPSADLGFGDNSKTVSLNGDFRYRIPMRRAWQPYLGAGIGINFISANQDAATVGNDNKNETLTGGHLIVGADVLNANRSRFFLELKLGMADAPDMKALAGWSFRAR